MLEPHEFKQAVSSRGTCHRWQLPLKLAWSITVHKSQGLSIDAVRMDLSRCGGTAGQAYVGAWLCSSCLCPQRSVLDSAAFEKLFSPHLSVL